MEFYYITNIFNLRIFHNEMMALLKCFEICMEIHFVTLFFLNERNITTSLLMIHLKDIVVHYANLNVRSISKPFLNRLLNILFCFFRFIIYVYMNKAFVKHFMEKLSFYNTNFQNSFQDIVYYRIKGCETSWY